ARMIQRGWVSFTLAGWVRIRSVLTRLRDTLFSEPVLQQIAQQKGISVAQLLLAWVIRKEGVLAIPKASSVTHVQENAAALKVQLSDEELNLINQIFPPPQHKLPLDVV
ncbi:aldo/keto reductase, partial [Mixta mediterraneensis]|uniref:aldo/keto reductase n=1 Tax=Mixta mediterraneensis TaxID=2758443 RepID=UPI001876DC4E